MPTSPSPFNQLALFDPDRYNDRPPDWYPRYLRSAWWLRRRRLFLRGRRVCMLCGRRRPLEVHHVSYARLGREHDADLIALCARCHARHHGTTRPRSPGPGR